jgi:hypothetical protein
MTGGAISNPRPTFETAAEGAAAKGDDGSKKERKKREPKLEKPNYKTVEQVLSQPICPASDLVVLGIHLSNTQRKRLEEKNLFPQRRQTPGCKRKVFYRTEDIVAHLAIMNGPQWTGTDAHYLALLKQRNGGGNAA